MALSIYIFLSTLAMLLLYKRKCARKKLQIAMEGREDKSWGQQLRIEAKKEPPKAK